MGKSFRGNYGEKYHKNKKQEYKQQQRKTEKLARLEENQEKVDKNTGKNYIRY